MRDQSVQGQPSTHRLYRRNFPLYIATVVVAAAILVCGNILSNGQEPTLGDLKNLDRSQAGSDIFGGDPGGSGSRRRVSNSSLELEISPPATSKSQVADTTQEDSKGLPQCYSSFAASPSQGAWRRCEGGVNQSIASLDGWVHPGIGFEWLQTCQTTWNQMHPNEGPMPYWMWEPEACSLRAVTAANFCHAMQGRKGVLFIGDSITHLSSTTLASILRAQIVTKTLRKDVWWACEGKLSITFIRDEHLFFGSPKFKTDECQHTNGNRTETNRCIALANEKVLSESDVLVVNSGAHKREEPWYRSEMMAASESLASSMRRLHGNDTVLIARNTVPGHSECNERMFDGPVDSEVAARLVAGGPPAYKWNTFRDKNARLEEAFSSDKGWVLLDAYTPTVLRADMHHGGNDCLHYCMPGPADHWITLLYNIILVATERGEGE